MKEEKFPHSRKPLHWQRREWQGQSFRATEESAATGVQRAKQRESRTEDRCQPALTSLRGAPPKRALEMGASCGYQRGPQRRA